MSWERRFASQCDGKLRHGQEVGGDVRSGTAASRFADRHGVGTRVAHEERGKTAMGAPPDSPMLTVWRPWGPRCGVHSIGTRAKRDVACVLAFCVFAKFRLALFDQHLLQIFERKCTKV
jgi:hypothetical protein